MFRPWVLKFFSFFSKFQLKIQFINEICRNQFDCRRRRPPFKWFNGKRPKKIIAVVKSIMSQKCKESSKLMLPVVVMDDVVLVNYV